jgi:DNA-binding XRE family transcriptional regulator
MSRPGQNKGIKNIKAKLSEADVQAIFVNKGKTQQALALQYNVTQSTINHIKTGRTWSWLTNTLQKS